MTSTAQVKTRARVGDGAGRFKTTGSSLGTSFRISYATKTGQEQQDFFRIHSRRGYDAYFPVSIVVNAQDVLVIDGREYEVVFSSCDQTEDDKIQHYAELAR